MFVFFTESNYYFFKLFVLKSEIIKHFVNIRTSIYGRKFILYLSNN